MPERARAPYGALCVDGGRRAGGETGTSQVDVEGAEQKVAMKVLPPMPDDAVTKRE